MYLPCSTPAPVSSSVPGGQPGVGTVCWPCQYAVRPLRHSRSLHFPHCEQIRAVRPDSASVTSKTPRHPAKTSTISSPRRSEASADLLQALTATAFTQGLIQLQSASNQLQEARAKLTKGFSRRPPGFPPGAVAVACSQQLMHTHRCRPHALMTMFIHGIRPA